MADSGAERGDRPGGKAVRLRDLQAAMEAEYSLNERRSVTRVKVTFKHALAHFGNCLASMIDSEALAEYAAARMEEVARGTVRTELSLLRRAFRIMCDHGRVQMPKFPQIREPDPRKGFLEPEVLDSICEELPRDLVPLIAFLDLTGWRVSEAQGLQWRAVDFEAGTVRLEPGESKTGKGRTFPFKTWPALERILSDQRQLCRMHERILGTVIPWVFYRWHSGGQIKDYRRAWRSACKRAGYPGRLVHDLRRTAVRRLERAGVPRSVAMQLTGHKTESIYARYAITNEADLADGVRRVAESEQARQRRERRQ